MMNSTTTVFRYSTGQNEVGGNLGDCKHQGLGLVSFHHPLFSESDGQVLRVSADLSPQFLKGESGKTV